MNYKLNGSHSFPTVLQMVWLPLISRQESGRRKKAHFGWISLQKTLCTFTKGKDTCNGDSGGPLMKLDRKAGELVLVGLTSWGPANCGLQREAGVYTSVADHLTWIQ